MEIIIPTILQIQQFATVFNGNVGGAAEYADAVDNQLNLPLPSAYVVYMGDDDAENLFFTGMQQYLNQHFSVFVITDSTNDRVGLSGMTLAEEARLSLYSAIYNWFPDALQGRIRRGIKSNGSELITFDRSRLIYKYDFSIETLFTDQDGFILPTSNITSIQGNFTLTSLNTNTVTNGITFNNSISIGD
jgi:hypothetical protein